MIMSDNRGYYTLIHIQQTFRGAFNHRLGNVSVRLLHCEPCNKKVYNKNIFLF